LADALTKIVMIGAEASAPILQLTVMSASAPSGKMLPFWRLDPPFRFAVYIAFAVLFASGAAWLIADRMKETSEAEIWQESAATLLMLHGGPHVDLDAPRRPRPRAYRARLAGREKPRHRDRHACL